MKHIITVFNEVKEFLSQLKEMETSFKDTKQQEWNAYYNPLWIDALNKLDNACEVDSTSKISEAQDRCITLIIEDKEHKTKMFNKLQKYLEQVIIKKFGSIEELFGKVKKVLRVYVAIVCTEVRNKEGEELFVLNDRTGLIKRLTYSLLEPLLEVLKSKKTAHFNEILKLIDKYMRQEDRLVRICINIFERNLFDCDTNDKIVRARRVFEKIGLPVALSLEEHQTDGSNFYRQLGIVDIKSGSVDDVISSIFSPSVILSDENMITIENSGGHSLSVYDEAVYNALSLLWLVGHENDENCNEYITPRMVFQVLSWNFSKTINNDCGDKSRDDIISSINALRETTLSIDVIDAEKKGAYRYEGSLLPSEWENKTGVNSKNKTDSIHLFRCPPLYDYAMKTGHISEMFIPDFIRDASGTEVPQFNSSKKEIIMIREYLLVKILTSKKQGKTSFFLVLTELYKLFNLHNASYKQLNDARTRLQRSLDDLQQLSYVKNYAVQKSGAQIIGYKVDI